MDENNCTCGHTEDEHGGDKQYRGSTACTVDDCDCTAYEHESDE